MLKYWSGKLGQMQEFIHQSDNQELMFHMLGADQEKGFELFSSLFDSARDILDLSVCETLIDLVHEYDPILTKSNALKLLYCEGKLAQDTHRWKDAVTIFKKVAKDEISPAELVIKSYNRLGMVYAFNKNWKESIQIIEIALKLVQENDQKGYLQWRILHDLGTIYLESGQLKEADQFLTKSVSQAEVNGNNLSMAINFNSLGRLFYFRGQLDKAIEYYSRSLDCLHANKDVFRTAQVYNNLGQAYANKGEWEKSETYFKKCLDIENQAGNTSGQAFAHNNLVRVFQNMNQPNEAFLSAKRAYELFLEIKDFYNAAVSMRNLARLYKIKPDKAATADCLRTAIKCFDKASAGEDVEITQHELDRLFRKGGLPWWAWLPIILFGIIMLVAFVAIVLEI